MGVTTAATYAFGVARNGKNLRIPQGNAELVNECPHGTDIQKQKKTIVGIEQVGAGAVVAPPW